MRDIQMLYIKPANSMNAEKKHNPWLVTIIGGTIAAILSAAVNSFFSGNLAEIIDKYLAEKPLGDKVAIIEKVEGDLLISTEYKEVLVKSLGFHGNIDLEGPTELTIENCDGDIRHHSDARIIIKNSTIFCDQYPKKTRSQQLVDNVISTIQLLISVILIVGISGWFWRQNPTQFVKLVRVIGKYGFRGFVAFLIIVGLVTSCIVGLVI